MAQIFRVKIPNKRNPSVLEIADQETVTSHKSAATEFILNNTPKAENVPKQRTSSFDSAFLPRNGINQSLVKQLSYSNLVNGNYKSGPTVPRQGQLGSIPKLTVTQAEDWCIGSSIGSMQSNDECDQRCNSDSCVEDELREPLYTGKRVEELVKMQEALLERVQILTNVVAENEQLQAKKYEWNMVASIFDQAFRILFLLMFFLSTLTIFYFSKS